MPDLASEPALKRFAERLRTEKGATEVLLFGSRATGQALPDSDYDLIVVSPWFEGVAHPTRAWGLRDMWYASGGRAPMDLFCLTPDEFESARQQITLVAAVLPHSVSLLPVA